MFNFFKKKIKVATHNGSFHADEVFACATLSLWADKESKKLKIIRTRDQDIVEKVDIAVDVGMQYDPAKNRFDHHQKDGAGTHDNGIPHASFGLVWKHYGELICGNKQVAKVVERKLVVPIDAKDNGINIVKSLISGVLDYSVSKEMIYAFRPTWQDAQGENDKKFNEYFEICKQILENEIRLCKSIIAGKERVRKQMQSQIGSEILILEQDLPWEQIVPMSKGIKVVIYPRGSEWRAESVREDLSDYESHRILFPALWRGLRDNDLAEVTGIRESTFSHKDGWMVSAQTKEGALEMAKAALREGEK